MATNRHTYTLRSLLTSLPKYIFAFMHTCMHAYIHTYIDTYIPSFICTCMHTFTCHIPHHGGEIHEDIHGLLQTFRHIHSSAPSPPQAPPQEGWVGGEGRRDIRVVRRAESCMYI